MSEVYATLEESDRRPGLNGGTGAAILIRTESARAKDEAGRTRREIDDLRGEVRAAKAEFETVRIALGNQVDDRGSESVLGGLGVVGGRSHGGLPDDRHRLDGHAIDARRHHRCQPQQQCRRASPVA